MPVDISIGSLLGKQPRLSLEFFPPKTPELAEDLLRNAEAIATNIKPDFVSITYGAGGSTREKTYAFTQLLRERFGWAVMPHLTCVGHSRDELLGIAESYRRMGVRNLMALRGDAPKTEQLVQRAHFCQYASELVSLVKKELPDMCLGVAGYPEKHPEAVSLEADIGCLKHKVVQGAAFITTQMFFDNCSYLEFVKKCRAQDIKVPIIPGLLPVLTLEQARKFCGFCGAKLPQELVQAMEGTCVDDQWRIGVEWTLQQAEELLKNGAPGIHLYILNRSQSLLQLTQKLNERGFGHS